MRRHPTIGRNSPQRRGNSSETKAMHKARLCRSEIAASTIRSGGFNRSMQPQRFYQFSSRVHKSQSLTGSTAQARSNLFHLSPRIAIQRFSFWGSADVPLRQYGDVALPQPVGFDGANRTPKTNTAFGTGNRGRSPRPCFRIEMAAEICQVIPSIADRPCRIIR
jgi:hypothetical protein